MRRMSDGSSDVGSSDLPQGACLQVLNFASPRIGSVVGPWFAPRYEQGGIYAAISRARTTRLYDLVWSSGSAHAPFHARHVHLIDWTRDVTATMVSVRFVLGRRRILKNTYLKYK